MAREIRRSPLLSRAPTSWYFIPFLFFECDHWTIVGEPSPMLRVVEKWCRTKETTLGEAEEVEVPHDPSQRGN
jgi:hypothetical protein